MKKYLLIALMLLACDQLFAQSLTINDLTNISNLSTASAHNYLAFGKGFKRQYIQQVDGNTVEHLHKINPGNKEETVVIGVENTLSSGTILRTVTYTSVVSKEVQNLIGQAKHLGLQMRFQGADAKNDIYLFDNNFFHIVIFLNHDNISGSVEVHQKEYLGFD